MRSRQFELQVFKRKGDEMGLAFSEQPSKSDKNVKGTNRKEIKVWGFPFKVMTETLLKTLKRQGYRPYCTVLTKKRPIYFGRNLRS